MSTYQTSQPFRFLDLPGEIRNSIYDLLLCSWDVETEQASPLIPQLNRRCLSYRSSTLLRVNKQLHAEASHYMIKRNQFVRITCRGLVEGDLFLNGNIPIITTHAQKVSQFSGHLMHMTLFKPVFEPSASQWSDFEILMLRADLPKLCEQLDIESAMITVNTSTSEHVSLRAEVKFNYAHTRLLTWKIQEYLLSPVAIFLRGLPNLRILGPVDPNLARAVIDDVARPRWTDPELTLEEIGTGVDVGKRQWQQNNSYSAAESWAYAMRTLERMRHSTSWLILRQAGGEGFVNKTADLYFTLNLFHAQFLQVDMASGQASSPFVQRNGRLAIQHLLKCEVASARFARHAGATWVPSNQQFAKMRFRHARCLRLMHDTASRVRAVEFIEEAAALAPNEMAIRDEKDAILRWNAQIEDSQRLVEESVAEVVGTENSDSMWSTLWAAVIELAA